MFKSTLSLVKLTPLLIFLAGLIFIGVYMIRNLPTATLALFTRVESPREYSFKSYDKLLKEFVKEGLVDYGALKKSDLLDKSLKELASTSPTNLNTESQACYWLNAHNLLTIKIITDRYPIKTLQDIGLDRASRRFVVGGETLSIQKLYGNKLMPVLMNRAIPTEAVFLICGGSLAYPPLTEHAILSANLENDAKVAAYRYLTNEKNVYFNRATGAFLISNLMKRYSRKFAQIDQDPFSMCTLYLTKEQCPDLTDIMLTKTYFSKIDHRVNSLEYLEGIKPKTPDHETDKKEAPAKNNSKTGS